MNRFLRPIVAVVGTVAFLLSLTQRGLTDGASWLLGFDYSL